MKEVKVYAVGVFKALRGKEAGSSDCREGKTIWLGLKARGWDRFILKVAVVGSDSFGT